jgi:competence protein ComEA
MRIASMSEAHPPEVSMVRSKWSRWVASCVAIVVAGFAFAGVAQAAVDVNSADQSQLESVKGIGPALSGKILAARKQGSFKDWSDLETRVSGIGEKNSLGFSRNGLTVGGRAKEGAQATGDAGRSAKSSSKKPAPDGSGSQIASSAKKSP